MNKMRRRPYFNHRGEKMKAHMVAMLIFLAGVQVCCDRSRQDSVLGNTSLEARAESAEVRAGSAEVLAGSAEDQALLSMDLEQPERLSLPHCPFRGPDGLVVIDSNAALAANTQCPPGMTPELDFSQRRLVVLSFVPDIRMLGYERREHDGAIVIHTRYHRYPRGAMVQLEIRAFFVPRDGAVEHVRHVVTTPFPEGAPPVP